jgi:hypothetical protein
MDGVFGRKPADFLLSPDLRIQSTYYGRDAGDFMPFAEIDRFLMARPESLWPDNYGRAPASRPSGYPDPNGLTSGRSYPGQGRSAPDNYGNYGNYPSGQPGQSRPDDWRSGNSGNSGW